jgi:Domain of unknown function (DUF6265)
MQRAAGVVSLVAVLVLGTRSVQAMPPDAASLAWLEGHWSGEKDGVWMEEIWTGVRGGALLGMHRDVKAGRLVSWEFFRVDTTPDGIVYFASPRSAPPTPFRLVEAGSERAVFENPAHDFPQRLVYWRDAKGALHARIEGPHGGETVSEEWVWTKTP